MIDKKILAKIKNLPVKKIVIVGAPGSGKSTIAKALSEHLGISLVEADKIFWQKDGTHLSELELIHAVGQKLKNLNAWVFEGHFKTCHGIVLKEATLVIELNMNFWASYSRYCYRELFRSDTSLKSKLKKLVFVPLNHHKIMSARKAALLSYGGDRIVL
jgi:adenylate kinase family enzyme